MPLPVTINLMALAEELEFRGGKRKLTGALKSAWRAQSCLADLYQVRDICTVIDSLKLSAAPLDQVALVHSQSALMTTAILLYARATSTGGTQKERGSIQLDLNKLTPQQRDDHKALIKIRNSALGHVETSANIGGDLWHVDYLFAKLVGPGRWGIASASTSIGLNYETIEMLKRQLPVAIEAIRAKSQQRLDDVQAVLQEVNPSSATMMRHQVDPIDWFGSLESARTMLSGQPGEESSSWIPLPKSGLLTNT